jgi:hypothetical protein
MSLTNDERQVPFFAIWNGFVGLVNKPNIKLIRGALPLYLTLLSNGFFFCFLGQFYHYKDDPEKGG